MQRIEVFDGIAILASNLKENLDSAFVRRFESFVYFPIPRPADRARLWKQGFSDQAPLAPNLDLTAIAREHTLSGGAIMNVIHYVSLESIKHDHRPITTQHLVAGIRRELAKSGQAT